MRKLKKSAERSSEVSSQLDVFFFSRVSANTCACVCVCVCVCVSVYLKEVEYVD